MHLLFPNLNQLLNFQRKFLIRVEGTAEMPWHDQRWGSLFSNNVSSRAPLPFPLVLSPVSPLSPPQPAFLSFISADLPYLAQQEEDFAVYEPYCANYVNATSLMTSEGEKLMVRTLDFPAALRFLATREARRAARYHIRTTRLTGPGVRLCTCLPTEIQPPHQRQIRAARLSHQAGPAHLQVPASARCEYTSPV